MQIHQTFTTFNAWFKHTTETETKTEFRFISVAEQQKQNPIQRHATGTETITFDEMSFLLGVLDIMSVGKWIFSVLSNTTTLYKASIILSIFCMV